MPTLCQGLYHWNEAVMVIHLLSRALGLARAAWKPLPAEPRHGPVGKLVLGARQTGK